MQNNHDDEGPAWNKFWLSMDHESDSFVSGSHHPTANPSHVSPEQSRHGLDGRGSVMPNESASHNGIEGVESQSEFMANEYSPHDDHQSPFPFKFKAPSGRVHRVNVFPNSGVTDLVSQVTAKLGPEVEAVGGEPVFEDDKLSGSGFALSYLDNEGDTVSITTDQDLRDAVNLSRQSHHDKVDLFVHDPTQPPMPPVPEPSRTATQSEDKSVTVVDEEQPAEDALKPTAARSGTHHSHHPEEQFIAGVPNELLLPGAIVTLAAVIAVVFTLSRTGGSR